MSELYTIAQQKLKEFWGFETFRSGQDVAVKSVLESKDTLVLFPTGGGKSLCYQVPATVFEGLTLVISPLVALMQDQVQQLNNRGISATFINSTIPNYEVEQRLVNARNGMYKLLYCAPERLSTTLFQVELLNLNIQLVAIDEAHCISEWGHEFRPAYREIRSSLEKLPATTRWLALTATATPEVRKDILENLEFEDPNVISQGFERANLKWWIIHTSKKREKIISAVSKASAKGDGLMYGGTRKNCEYWAKFFTQKGIKAEAYHAGIDAGIRKQVQQNWVDGTTPLVVATNAFGMGIDKPNCVYVVHEEMPYSIEAYYQEAGRAGRDGNESFPILFYQQSDYVKARNRLEQNYPDRKQFEAVYQGLCDSFDLAVGAMMDRSEVLDLKSISNRSKQPEMICKSVIRLLSQFGIIAYEEQIKPAFSIQFSLSQQMLSKFKERCYNIEKAEFVDKLERTLGSYAFIDMKEIEEEVLVEKMGVNRNGLVKALNVLMQNDHVLIFTTVKSRSLAKVLEARSSQLPLSKDDVEKHRTVLVKKLDAMNQFVNSGTCREVFLKNYFGDSGTTPCGHCDNCLDKTAAKMSVISSDMLNKTMQLLREGERTAKEIKKFLQLDNTGTQLIIRSLLSEGKIVSSSKNPGYYSLSSELA